MLWVQVSLQVAAADLECLESALWVSKQLLQAAAAAPTAHIPATAAAAAAAEPAKQQQQELVSGLSTASLLRLKQLQQQHTTPQEQPAAHSQQQQPTYAASLQLRVLLLLLQLAAPMSSSLSSESSSSSSSRVHHLPASWWSDWCESAGVGNVLQAASLQQLLTMAQLLQHAPALPTADGAAAAAGADATSSGSGSSSGGSSLDSVMEATGDAAVQQQQQQLLLLQTWLVSQWLPALTVKLERGASAGTGRNHNGVADPSGPSAAPAVLTLQQQAALVKTVSGVLQSPLALPPPDTLHLQHFLDSWSTSCVASIQLALSAAAEAADNAAATVAAARSGSNVAAAPQADAAAAAAAAAAGKVLGSGCCAVLCSVVDSRWPVTAAVKAAAAQLVLGVVTSAAAAAEASAAAAAVSASDSDQQQQQQQRQLQSMLVTAAQALLLFARFDTQQCQTLGFTTTQTAGSSSSSSRSDGGSWMVQLQQQLPVVLAAGDMRVAAMVLWAFAAEWKATPSPSCLAAALQRTQALCMQSSSTPSSSSSSSSSSHLRVLLLSLALLEVQQLPQPWLQAILQYTGQAMVSAQQQQQQSPEFLADVGWSLARLGVTPGPRWQALWRGQVAGQIGAMRPQQLVDCLQAAAAWQQGAEAAARAARKATAAAAAGDGVGVQQGEVVAGGQAAGGVADGMGAGEKGYLQASSSSSNDAAVGDSGVSTGADAAAAGASLMQQQQNSSSSTSSLPFKLLHRPAYRPLAATSTNSNSTLSSAAAGGRSASSQAASATAAAAAAAAVRIPQPWLEALLLQLRQQFGACSPRQLTCCLRSLGQLGVKAPVDWLDALYDAALLQLPGCSMVQLLQLLQGLVQQQHDLAPARVDAVMQHYLLRLQDAAEGDNLRVAATGAAAAGGDAGAWVQPNAALVAGTVAGVSTAAGRQRSSVVQPRLVVWMLQLAAKLRYEPPQDWCEGVAGAVQRSLLHSQAASATAAAGAFSAVESVGVNGGAATPAAPTSSSPITGSSTSSSTTTTTSSSSSSSSSSSGWTPELLAELLEYMAQLEFDLPAASSAAFRSSLRPLLPCCSGQQLAVLLSATTRLHWYQVQHLHPRRTPAAHTGAAAAQTAAGNATLDCTAAGTAPIAGAAAAGTHGSCASHRSRRQGGSFLRQVLLLLQRRLLLLDPASLGRAGAAVSQLGLVMPSGTWSQPFMAAVRAVVDSREPLAATEVADLQRSVQYLAWCRGRSGGRLESRAAGQRAGNSRSVRVADRMGGHSSRGGVRTVGGYGRGKRVADSSSSSNSHAEVGGSRGVGGGRSREGVRLGGEGVALPQRGQHVGRLCWRAWHTGRGKVAQSAASG